MNFLITHFQRKSSNPNGWFETMFIACEEGNQNVSFWGFEINNQISEEEIKYLESTTFQKLDKPEKSDGTKTIWIASDKHVYLANSKNPFIDERKEII